MKIEYQKEAMFKVTQLSEIRLTAKCLSLFHKKKKKKANKTAYEIIIDKLWINA